MSEAVVEVKPPDLVVTLATAVACNQGRLFPGDGWTCADQIAVQLKAFGFGVRSQQVAAYLARVGRLDSPPVEIRRTELPWLDYRITPAGRLWISNLLPGIEVRG